MLQKNVQVNRKILATLSVHCTLYSLGLHEVNAPLYCRLQVYTVMVLLLPNINLPKIAPQSNNSQR